MRTFWICFLSALLFAILGVAGQDMPIRYAAFLLALLWPICVLILVIAGVRKLLR
jgi:hypothetical protein